MIPMTTVAKITTPQTKTRNHNSSVFSPAELMPQLGIASATPITKAVAAILKHSSEVLVDSVLNFSLSFLPTFR